MFLVKFVEITALGNIMEFMHAMVAPDFSKDLLGEIDNIFVSHKSQDYVLLTKLIEISAVHVVYRDVLTWV